VRTAAGAPLQWLDDLSGATVRVLALDGALDDAGGKALAAALAPLRGRLLRLVVGSPADEPPGPAQAANAGDRAGLRFTEEATLMADWLRSLGAAFAIVRPDHQVFATTDDIATAQRQLAALASAIGGPERTRLAVP